VKPEYNPCIHHTINQGLIRGMLDGYGLDCLGDWIGDQAVEYTMAGVAVDMMWIAWVRLVRRPIPLLLLLLLLLGGLEKEGRTLCSLLHDRICIYVYL
jgi:hypothetical protein